VCPPTPPRPDAALIDAPTDASPDAAIDAPVTVGCLDPGNGTTFSSGTPCVGWGTAFVDSAMVQQAGGRLTITPFGGAIGNGGCVHAAVPFAAAGTLAEVERTVDGPAGRTRLELDGAGTSIGNEGGMLVARANDAVVTSVAYDATAMRWWRMRPDGGGVLFETSADGQAWTLRASSPLAPPASAPIRVVGATVAAVASPGSARFLSVNLCP
jgi:hypothetical protein